MHVCHIAAKNNSLLQSTKEFAQCARINAVARTFLIRAETWETAMRKVSEYERQAAECRKLAAQMKTLEQRKQLEDAAEVWDRLARERRVGIVENTHDQAQPQTEK
jgi:hypothetical protein